MVLSIMKISPKPTKAFKKKKVYWSIRAGGADIAEYWAREADPAGLEARIRCGKDGVLHRVGPAIPTRPSCL